MRSRLRAAAEVFGWGCALLAMVQLPGAVLDLSIRRTIGLPQVVTLLTIAGAAAALTLARNPRRPHGWRFLAALAVAFGIAAGLAQATQIPMARDTAEVSEFGILVPAPGRSNECRGLPRRCQDLVVNELGFRGELAHRSRPDAKLVAVVGDSHVFGSGVGEQDTVPAALGRNLSDLEPPVTVVNAGVAGINGDSFRGIIEYAKARLGPDVFAVLLKDDDLDETDKFSRWAHFRHSFWFRVFFVSNIEPIYETGRQLGRYWSPPDLRVLLIRQLDAIAGAASGTKLLLVVAFSADVQPVFDQWVSRHPEVAFVTSWDHPEYWQAERIPYDGHWTEAGCRQIAEIVAPALRNLVVASEGGARPPGALGAGGVMGVPSARRNALGDRVPP